MSVITNSNSPQVTKRADFDEFQKKWDRFDKDSSDDEGDVRVTSSAARISSGRPAAPPPTPAVADEAVVAQLVSMGFSEGLEQIYIYIYIYVLYI